MMTRRKSCYQEEEEDDDVFTSTKVDQSSSDDDDCKLPPEKAPAEPLTVETQEGLAVSLKTHIVETLEQPAKDWNSTPRVQTPEPPYDDWDYPRRQRSARNSESKPRGGRGRGRRHKNGSSSTRQEGSPAVTLPPSTPVIQERPEVPQEPATEPVQGRHDTTRRLYFFHDERGSHEESVLHDEPPKKTIAGLYSRWDDDDEGVQVLGGEEMDSSDGRQGVSEGGRRRYLFDVDQLNESQWRHDKFDADEADQSDLLKESIPPRESMQRGCFGDRRRGRRPRWRGSCRRGTRGRGGTNVPGS
eukprot:Blabericola_migrator_1__4252@NODE_22_length_22262_cov_139_742014_g19_i0_p11_GENE_NODE_22_length_22262_cov_139_742014_g19_i0NODE_22_length_22262_cov_139_742014_g19_i0_p11_ORF_typecomplete_len301_score54_91_NODE_22_length_22262_cov_139_742014_g19_i01994420846